MRPLPAIYLLIFAAKNEAFPSLGKPLKRFQGTKRYFTQLKLGVNERIPLKMSKNMKTKPIIFARSTFHHFLFIALAVVAGVHPTLAQNDFEHCADGRSCGLLLACDGYELRFAKHHRPCFTKSGSLSIAQA